jgi:hypothetical protein
MVIHHNHPTRADKTQWYMAAGSTPERFVFMDAGSNRAIIRSVRDGWTWDDAISFGALLIHHLGIGRGA